MVSYHPSLQQLRQLLQTLSSQVALTIVVDNGSSPADLAAIRAFLGPQQSLVPLARNEGIAVAQNRGMALAVEHGAAFVLLLDQDSHPEPDMAGRLKRHIVALLAAGQKVAAVGPRIAGWRGRQGDGSETVQVVDHLIASGSMIPTATLQPVGGMLEELFIDYVDIEWGLRAGRLGYRSFVAADVVMEHQLGTPMRILGRTISTHSPMRHYYMVRNGIWLLRQSWLPSRWRFRVMPKVALHLLLNAVFAKPHRDHWRMMGRGFADGLAGRMGKAPDSGQD